MQEPEYLHRVDALFKQVQDLFEPVDPDDAEAYQAGDVLTITFSDRSRCVINTQRSTRQVWMAHGARAWHFQLNPVGDRWEDDKGRGEEFFATLAAITHGAARVELRR
jgi:CyaY protein